MVDHPACCEVHRRRFLSGSLLAGAAAAGVGLAATATAAPLTQAARDALTPDRVVEMMLEGNARFLDQARK